MAKTTKKKKKLNNSSVIAIIICCGIVLCLLVSIIKSQVKYNKQQSELAALQSTYESLTAENQALEDAVSGKSEAELAEEYARKKGYVMPDERVYVDITPGNE